MADNDRNNDMHSILQRMRQEFGAQQSNDSSNTGESDTTREPIPGEAQPISTPQTVAVRLPASQVRAAWILLAMNVVLFGITQIMSTLPITQNCFGLSSYSCALRILGWKENALIAQGQYWRLLTAMFLHGNLIHILFNGYALYILGPEAERIYGTLRFLALYFLAGLAGSVASYAFSPAPSVGASGAIFGLVGGLAAFYYVTRDVLGDYGRNQLRGMIAIVIINLLIGFGGSGVIDNNAHIGGLLGGGLVGLSLAPRYAINRQLLPIVITRHFHPFGWIGAAGMLLFLMTLVLALS